MDRDPEVVRRWERMVVAKYEAIHMPATDKATPPTASEVESYYQTHSTEHTRPERVRVALIQMKGATKSTQEKQAEFHARAEHVLTLARAAGTDFADLARRHSDDRGTRYSGGDSGWMERGQVPPSWPREVVESLFAPSVPEGSVSLIEAGGSAYIVKVLGREPAGPRPLSEVRDRIVFQLEKQRRLSRELQFHTSQRAGLKIEIYQSALDAVPLPVPGTAKAPGTPPSTPSN